MKKAILRTTGVAALAATVLFTGCGNKIKSDATLIEINKGDGTKDTITLGYGNFVARYQQSMFDQYYPMMGYDVETMWQQDMMGGLGYTMEDQTKSGIITDLEQMYVVKEHAADYGVVLTDEQNAAIAEAAAKFMADNPKDTLEELGATEEYVKKYLEDKTIYKLVQQAAEEAAEADITDDQCWMRTFSYVFIDTTGTDPTTGTVTELTEDDIKALKEKAEAIADADDFDAEVEAQGETSLSKSYLKGETEDDSMDMSIIEAAEGLKEGEVSDVIEVADAGYYVIKLTADHDEDASANKRDTLKSDAFNELVDGWVAAYVWTVNDEEWAKVNFDTFFKTLQKEEPATEETTETTEEVTEETTEESTETDETVEDSEEKTEESTDDTAEESAAE